MNDSNDTKIAVLQNQMNNIEKKVDEGFADAKLEITNLSLKIDNFINTADGRYSPSWVGDAMKGVIAFIILAVIAAFMNFILRKP